jgi:formylglycine-generating enzyme required for sulfatase activity
MNKCKWIAALPLALAAAAQAQVQVEMVRVPGGCFQMGSEAGEKHEKPVHQVCLKDFEIGKTEVTQGQWQAVMGSNPSKFPLSDKHPVDNVSWNEAQAFIQRLNAAGGPRYRLPTEAEWEYACRSGGKDETFSGTSNGGEVSQVAWFNKDEAGNMTHPVGTKKPNGLGIHDMSGNVWEWTADLFVSPYVTGTTENKYVARGGSWDGKINYVRCAIRNRYDADRRDYRIGLRLARDAQ